jgi:hypothetical protein
VSFVTTSDSEAERRLNTLRLLQRFLDDAFRAPGTGFHFGWDAVIGLIPWVGDLVTMLMACAIIVEAHRRRTNRLVQFRMLVNVGVDLAIGLIPLAGDVADACWKANKRNLALLERHAAKPGGMSAGDWAFAVGAMVSLVAIAIVPLLLWSWMLSALFEHDPV